MKELDKNKTYCTKPRWLEIKERFDNRDFDHFISAYSVDDNAQLLDVRTHAEYESGHLPDAINIDYLSKNLAELLDNLDLSKHYYIYCRSGRRSLRMCTILENMGVEQVVHLENGIADIPSEKVAN